MLMHYPSLRWLLNTLRNIFLKNPLVRISIRTLVLLWSTLSSRLSPWPRSHLYQPSSEGQQRARTGTESINASLDVGNIPLPDFGQQAHLQDTSSSGYIAQPSRSPTPDIAQTHSHIPDTTNAFPAPRSSSPVPDVAEPAGDVASLKTRVFFKHPTICPVFPECIGRYDRNVIM